VLTDDGFERAGVRPPTTTLGEDGFERAEPFGFERAEPFGFESV